MLDELMQERLAAAEAETIAITWNIRHTQVQLTDLIDRRNQSLDRTRSLIKASEKDLALRETDITAAYRAEIALAEEELERLYGLLPSLAFIVQFGRIGHELFRRRNWQLNPHTLVIPIGDEEHPVGTILTPKRVVVVSASEGAPYLNMHDNLGYIFRKIELDLQAWPGERGTQTWWMAYESDTNVVFYKAYEAPALTMPPDRSIV